MAIGVHFCCDIEVLGFGVCEFVDILSFFGEELGDLVFVRLVNGSCGVVVIRNERFVGHPEYAVVGWLQIDLLLPLRVLVPHRIIISEISIVFFDVPGISHFGKSVFNFASLPELCNVQERVCMTRNESIDSAVTATSSC